MKKLKISAAEMVASARQKIEEIEASDLLSMLDDPNVVIVDIRDITVSYTHLTLPTTPYV